MATAPLLSVWCPAHTLDTALLDMGHSNNAAPCFLSTPLTSALGGRQASQAQGPRGSLVFVTVPVLGPTIEFGSRMGLGMGAFAQLLDSEGPRYLRSSSQLQRDTRSGQGALLILQRQDLNWCHGIHPEALLFPASMAPLACL